MWPEFLLEKYFEASWIFFLYGFDNSLILQEIERTCWVDHLSANFQTMKGSIKEFFLEMNNLLDIFDMPVFHRISSLIEGSLSTTGSIEQYPVKSLGKMFPLLSWIECDSHVRRTHSFEIL